MAEITKLSVGQAFDKLRGADAPASKMARLDKKIEALNEETPRLKATRLRAKWNQRAGSTGRVNLKRIRRFSLAIIVLIPALYFLPIPTIFYLVCGALDIGRQKNVTVELIEKYFMGNGVLTWLLSPINLLADALSHRNKLVYRTRGSTARPSGRDRDLRARIRRQRRPYQRTRGEEIRA